MTGTQRLCVRSIRYWLASPKPRRRNIVSFGHISRWIPDLRRAYALLVRDDGPLS